jgi:hypothetical protein
MWDDLKQRPVMGLDFRTQVLKVRLSRTRIVVALQNSIHVYAFSSPPEKLSTYETTDNFNGLCCLGTEHIVFPGTAAGRVQLVGIKTGNISIIAAHTSSLKAMELSPDGQILATASDNVSYTSLVLNSRHRLTAVGHSHSHICNEQLCENRRATSWCGPCNDILDWYFTR